MRYGLALLALLAIPSTIQARQGLLPKAVIPAQGLYALFVLSTCASVSWCHTNGVTYSTKEPSAWNTNSGAFWRTTSRN